MVRILDEYRCFEQRFGAVIFAFVFISYITQCVSATAILKAHETIAEFKNNLHMLFLAYNPIFVS